MGLILVILVIFLLVTIAGELSNINTSTICRDKGEPHKWIEKGEKGNEYLVCEKCKMLPGGMKEENDGYSS